MIDLHTHSTASDGTFSPAELVDFAFSKGLKVLALTDHDTTDGLKEASDEAKAKGLIFVPGIEISVDWPTGEFHLLGLGLKETGEKLHKIINFLEEERKRRNKKMALKLQEEGVMVSYEEIQERFKSSNIGRPHFAQFMVEKGFVKTRQTAFNKYFAKGRPCYVERSGANLEDAVEAIKESGGIPVQAHPLSIYVSWGKIENVLTSIRDRGVRGLEAWHPGTRLSEAERLEKLAKDLGMTATGGSDFHGEKVRADRHIGHSAGGKKIEDRFYFENLLPSLESYRAENYRGNKNEY